MPISLDAGAEVFREAMRDTGKRYSLWYLIQGVLLIAAPSRVQKPYRS
jgi:hypothetical protein